MNVKSFFHYFRVYILSAIAFLVVLSSCFAQVSDKEDYMTLLMPSGDVISLEIAADPESRLRGLMFRLELEKDTGMIFVFPDSQVRRFWMKNTGIALSIAFIDENGRVVRVADMQPYSETPVSSIEKAKYAIEVNRGEFKRYNVVAGSILNIPKDLNRIAR